jgi:MFS family permease
MFNALNGLGGAGQFNATASDASNSAVYATFAVVGFFAGTVVNALGIRTSLSFGGLGYCVYVSSYLCYNHTHNLGYVVFAGLLLGCCAGILWSAQGAIMMSYPPERLKGRFISWFWIIFNLGAVIGSLVSSSRFKLFQTQEANFDVRLNLDLTITRQIAPLSVMALISASWSSPFSEPAYLGHWSMLSTLCVVTGLELF